MSTTVRTPLQARNLVSCTLYGGNIGSSGTTITWGSGVDIGSAAGTGNFDSFDLTPRFTKSDYAGSDATGEGNLPERAGFDLSISEVASADGSTVLETIASNCDFIKVVALYRKRGAVTGGTYRACIASISDIQLPLQTGRNVVRLTGNQADPNLPACFAATSLPAYF